MYGGRVRPQLSGHCLKCHAQSASENIHFQHFHILFGAVRAVGGYFLNGIHHIHSLDYLTKHGVAAVKVGSTANGGISLALLGGEFGRIFAAMASVCFTSES